MTIRWWINKIQQAVDEGQTDDQIGDLFMEASDHLDYNELREVENKVQRY